MKNYRKHVALFTNKPNLKWITPNLYRTQDVDATDLSNDIRLAADAEDQ